ncbi:MAG: hypothetical protein QNJ98_07140 [Planctomycetota bacterium]|nr:hypothetical protein [Planctomycetota bacterium]
MPFAEPRHVERTEDCLFYHSIELPGLGLVEGLWDLREVADDYLGGIDVQGKRVLDVGTASGFLTFTLERKGAEVISFDIGDDANYDFVPYADPSYDIEALRESARKRVQDLRNSYWLAHRLLASKARAVYGDVYDLPADLPQLDVVLFGMILGHLRDPFAALHAAARLTPPTIVITNQTAEHDIGSGPYAHFMPTPENREPNAWWGLSVGCLTQMLDVLGYDVVDVRSLWPLCLAEGRVGKEHCSSIVAKRR